MNNASWEEARTPFGPAPEERAAAALTERLPLGPRTVTIQVSPVCQYEDYGPEVDVVRLWALWDDGTVVTLRDVHPHVSREEAYRLWSFLCEQLAVAARLAYGLRAEGTPNPRLGCWGPRPDLMEAEIDDDSAIGLMIGLAIDRRGATRPSRDALLVLALRSAIVAALRSWLTAAQGHVPGPVSAN